MYSKSVADNSWGKFTNYLNYKLQAKGKQLIKIDKWYPSSKTCSNCSYKLTELALSTRTWQCPSCSIIHDRDINASKNIRTAGMAGAAWQSAS